MDDLTGPGGSPRSSTSQEPTAALFERCQDSVTREGKSPLPRFFRVRDTIRSAKIVVGRRRSEIPAAEGAAVWLFNG
jgi:hypothetical protein